MWRNTVSLHELLPYSVHGALQLKQDFDLIRELIRSEKYSLSEEPLHRLLSLRVFHQVDSAIVCLLQQPVNKPYMPSHRWEPFRHCCELLLGLKQNDVLYIRVIVVKVMV